MIYIKSYIKSRGVLPIKLNNNTCHGKIVGKIYAAIGDIVFPDKSISEKKLIYVHSEINSLQFSMVPRKLVKGSAWEKKKKNKPEELKNDSDKIIPHSFLQEQNINRNKINMINRLVI